MGNRAAWLDAVADARPPTVLVLGGFITMIEGDRLIPVTCALRRSAPSLVLDDAAHGQCPGRDWYGSDRFLDRWWPLAIDAWKTALIARAGNVVGPVAGGSPA